MSNEMLVVIGSKRIGACFVVDLNTLDPGNFCQIYKIYAAEDENTSKQNWYWFALIEGDDRFYILEITKEKHSPHSYKVYCRHQYIYRSQCLSQIELPAVFVEGNDLHPLHRQIGLYPPLFYEHIVQDKERVWIFSGNRRDTSSFTEVYVKGEGHLSTREHTPPPFSCMVGSFGAKLPYDYLLKKKFVTNYLLPR